MAEQLPASHPPDLSTTRSSRRPTARKNALLAWGLLGIFLLLFGGTFGVGHVYLWLS